MGDSSTNSASILLWGVSISPYVRKARIALAHKGLDYQQEQILPASLLRATGQPVPEAFIAASPLGRIPALRDGDTSVADSSIIAEYLDARFPDRPALFPGEPAARAAALWFERYADTALTHVSYTQIFLERVVKPLVLKVDTDAAVADGAIADQLPPLLDYLDRGLGKREWFAGTFSMADVGVGTQLVALRMAEVQVDASRWGNLAAFFGRFQDHPSVKPVLASE